MTAAPIQLSSKPRPTVGKVSTIACENLQSRDGIAWSSVVTLVLWTSCVTVGSLGFVLPYPEPRPPAKQPEPVEAEFLKVELSNSPLPPPEVAPSLTPDPSPPPPLLDSVAIRIPPPMIAVAQPSPAIAFALPVEGPARVVEAKVATHVAPPAEAAARPVLSASVQKLVHGQGEGLQPAPTYPAQALRAGQEGIVRVHFSVGENGRVIAADATEPCSWGLLNAAAVRVIRERWRFPAGPFRRYEVAIHFQIPK